MNYYAVLRFVGSDSETLLGDEHPALISSASSLRGIVDAVAIRTSGQAERLQ